MRILLIVYERNIISSWSRQIWANWLSIRFRRFPMVFLCSFLLMRMDLSISIQRNRFMNKILQRWTDDGILNEITKYKKLYIEPQNTGPTVGNYQFGAKFASSVIYKQKKKHSKRTQQKLSWNTNPSSTNENEDAELIGTTEFDQTLNDYLSFLHDHRMSFTAVSGFHR